VCKAETLPPSCAVVMKSGNLNFLEPSGHLGPVMGLLYFNLIFAKIYYLNTGTLLSLCLFYIICIFYIFPQFVFFMQEQHFLNNADMFIDHPLTKFHLLVLTC